MEKTTIYRLHFTFLFIYIINRRVKDYICCTCTLTSGEELYRVIKPLGYSAVIQSSNPQIKKIIACPDNILSGVQTMNGRVYDPTIGQFLSPPLPHESSRVARMKASQKTVAIKNRK